MASNNSESALGDFLQASRARITPEQAGLTLYGDRRRVSGLRREELAMLAGVSSSYYTRLEQGQSRHASAQVLDAIASALHLNDTERAYLRSLADAEGRRPALKRPPREAADPALLELLASVGDIPALVLGRRSDVLAWNPLGHALLAPHLDFDAPSASRTRLNLAALVFLDEETRSLYADWRAKSRAVVGNLRLVVGQHPDDPILASLIGSLSMASNDFASLWADHRVQPCATAVYEFQHPWVGRFAATQQTLRAIGSPDQTFVSHTAPSGSSSAEALALLAHIVAESATPQKPQHATGELRANRSLAELMNAPAETRVARY